jgi:hypothetical protein
MIQPEKAINVAGFGGTRDERVDLACRSAGQS